VAADDLAETEGYGNRLRPDRLAQRVKGDPLDISGNHTMRVGDSTTIARNTQRAAVGRGRGDRLGRAQHLPRFFLDGYAPQVHRAATIAGEIEVIPVGRPDGADVDGAILGNGNGPAAVSGGYRPDVALAIADSHVGDTTMMWRPVRS